MVLCIIALPIFAILAIFSVRYRKLTKDAFECLFKMVTLRKCSSGLDDRIRSEVTGTFLRYSPKTAGFFYRNYKVISWIIVILMLTSAYYSGVGVYNYAVYGNCNGPDSTQFCIFNPFGTGNAVNNSVDATPSIVTFDDCIKISNYTKEECLAHCGFG